MNPKISNSLEISKGTEKDFTLFISRVLEQNAKTTLKKKTRTSDHKAVVFFPRD